MDSIGKRDPKDDRFLSSQPLKPNHWNLIFAGIIVLLLGGLMWAIHDRFIPIQEGWFQYYSLLTQRDLLPYKDFYYFTQPIPLFITQLISKFSDGYMLFRYYGIVERLVLILAIYYLISRQFSPTATFIAVITSAFLYQSLKVDLFYTFYQTTFLFFLLSLICLQRGTGSHYPWLYNCFIGIFASLAFFTKQSNGLFVSLFLLFMMVWYTPRKLVLRRVFYFLLGWAIPALIIVGWLLKNQLLFAYINQVFGGSSSKGSILNILFGFWLRNHSEIYLSVFLLMLLILFILWKTKKLISNPDSKFALGDDQYKYIALFAFPLYFVIGFLIPSTSFMSTQIENGGYFYLLFWLYFPFFILTIAAVFIGVRWIFRKQLPFSKPLAVLMLASFVWIYSSGFSCELELAHGLLGTALVLAFLFERIKINWKQYKFFLIIASGFVLLFGVVTRNHINYDWWGWTEFGHSENVTSIIPAFQGFKLSYRTAGIYDRIYTDILKNTSSNDYVYTYPHIALFNYVTNRLTPTFSPVHYFDVCPDNIAIKDAAILRENPPKMIVFMKMPEKSYQFHENFFRNGQPSGQRDIDAAIEEIVNKYNYITIDAFTSPGWNWPIYVWLKP